jgi:hypothetical protein
MYFINFNSLIMKKIFIVLVFVVASIFNVIYISVQSSNIELSSLIQTAKADLENGEGSCWTVEELDSYYTYECVGGGYYEDTHFVYFCSVGTETSCTEGWASYVRYCDGTNYENSYFGQVPCTN